ncbi:MAG: Ig-like domain-containing protein, partial [Candidatus Limnocylindria bacterium]
MRPIRAARAAVAAPFDSLGTLLSSHRALTRVSLAALSFTCIIALNQQQTTVTQAGPELAPVIPVSLLPQNVGTGVSTDAPVTIDFDAAMNPGSVEEAVQVLPAQPVKLSWSEDLDQLTVAPERRWQTDESYVVVIGGSAVRTDGRAMSGASRYSFTTQTAPTVSDFQVRLAEDNLAEPKVDEMDRTRAAAVLDEDALSAEEANVLSPTITAKDVSATSAITVSFAQRMNPLDVESNFAISPEVEGDLAWENGALVFRPSERLEPGTRYTISVIGSHDRTGNLIGGKGNFSFIVQRGAQVTTTQPEADASDVEPATVAIWFSQPMDVKASSKAFALTDTKTDSRVDGDLKWNEAGTQLMYTPDSALPGGRTFEVTFDGGARDADGNKIDASLSFETKAAPVVVATRAPTSARTAPVQAPAPAAV